MIWCVENRSLRGLYINTYGLADDTFNGLPQMALTDSTRGKRAVSYLFLFLFILAFGCSAGDREEYSNGLMGHFSFGTGKYMKKAKSRNLMVRVNAIYYLGEKGAENALPMLIAFLSREEPREIRLNAIIALGKIKQSDSVDALIQLLQERDEQLRGEVAWALGQIREPKAIVPLAGLLNDSKVRLTAIWAMGNIGDESAVPLLTGLLTHENKFVRYNAAQSLKKIGNIN